MYRPPPMHAGAPWGQPPPQQPQPFFPNGDYGQLPPQWHQQLPTYPTEHAPSPQFHQEQRQAGGPVAHARGQGDELSQRLKEEQRRKQNEYSQALAEQVRQREAKKLQEREARRHEDMGGTGGHAIDPTTGQPKVERGFFDGFGQGNNNQRANFGRGRREAPQQQPLPLQPAALHQSPTQPQLHQIPPMAMDHQMQQGWSGYSEALGIAEFPQHPHVDPQHGLTPRQDAGPWVPPPHQHQQQTQPQQQPPVAAGRRPRTDLHNAGAGIDDAQAKRRQQQHLDMQDSLRRQIEEKQRLKQEEKRKREEEERREMERFEQEKRRQQEEQSRVKEEKRRKALAEEEHFRAQQMQLEAASAAAAHEKEMRHQRDQRNRQSPQKNAHNEDFQHGNAPQPAQQPHQNAPILQKNPFTNSRAHLFQDPPQTHVAAASVPASVPLPAHQPQHFHQTHAQAQHQHPHDRQFGHQPSHHHTQAHGYHPTPSPPVMDTQVLMEQYEQVRDELQRQRELVERLHEQIQQQQQQHRHQREDPRELPTLSDLERLRQELREELEQREMQHRHELASLRKQNQQQDHYVGFSKASPPKHSHQQKHHEPEAPSPEYQRPRQVQVNGRGPGRRHDAFVQDALDEDDGGEADDRLGHSSSHREGDHRHGGNQASSPHVAPRRNAMPPPQSTSSQKLLGSSLSASSLHCDSKLVFFDGRVQPTAGHRRSRSPEIIAEEPEQAGSDDESEQEEEGRTRADDSVDDLLQQFRRSFPRDKLQSSTGNQFDPRPPRRPHVSAAATLLTETDGEQDDNDDDSLGFFVKRLEANPAEPARYRASTDKDLPRAVLRHVEVDSPILQNMDMTTSDYGVDLDDEDDEDEESSLNGDKLEAIFQRNVRRHEILSGFEARTRHRNGAPEPMHWEQLQQLLRNVPAEVEKARAKGDKSLKEESLVASSRWMPSSLLH